MTDVPECTCGKTMAIYPDLETTYCVHHDRINPDSHWDRMFKHNTKKQYVEWYTELYGRDNGGE